MHECTKTQMQRLHWRFNEADIIMHVPSEVSSFERASLSICCSLTLVVCLRMLFRSRGTFVQCCIGEINRSDNANRWQRSSWQHHWNNVNQWPHSHVTLVYEDIILVQMRSFNGNYSNPNRLYRPICNFSGCCLPYCTIFQTCRMSELFTTIELPILLLLSLLRRTTLILQKRINFET